MSGKTPPTTGAKGSETPPVGARSEQKPPTAGAPSGVATDRVSHDFAPGELNDLPVPDFMPRYEGGKDDVFSAWRKMARDFYTPDTFSKLGPMRGVVLRIEEVPHKPVEEGFMGWTWMDFLDMEQATVKKMRVRIPEIHSMIPCPATIGKEATEADNKIIDLYDLFPPKDLDINADAVVEGDIVWVDYGNKLNWKDPVYLGAVNKKPSAGAGGMPPGGANAHANGCGGQYQRTSTTATGGGGTAMPAANAPQQPYQGLPRIARVDLEKGQWGDISNAAASATGGSSATMSLDAKWVVNEAAPYGKGTYNGFKKAAKACPYQLRVYYGHIPGNGEADKKNRPNARTSIVAAPWYFDATQPWELIYFFHGLGGFQSKSFSNRIIPNIKKLIKEKRNFVYVKPQLGHGAFGHRDGQTDSFNPEKHPGRGGDFAIYHNNIIMTIQKHITSTKTPIAKTMQVSMYAWSAGGATIGRIAASGAMAKIKPSRIFFADAEYLWGYGDVKDADGNSQGKATSALTAVWKGYVKDNPKVWLTCMTGTKKVDGYTKRKFNSIKKKNDISKRPVYYWATGKSHGWCGKNALFLICPEHKSRTLNPPSATTAAKAAAPPKVESNDKQAETEENKNTGVKPEEEKTGAEEDQGFVPKLPPKKETTETPKENKPKKSASEKPKDKEEKTSGGGIMGKMKAAVSDAKDKAVTSAKVASAKKKWTVVPSGPDTSWKENRVRIRHYGGTIKNKKDKLLAKIKGPNERGYLKAHLLVVKRYQAMKAAAAAAGVQMKVVSGWRKHKYKSFEDYEAKMLAKGYASAKAASKWIAFNSPHETGMALDINSVGEEKGMICQNRAETSGRNKNSVLGKWLIANAWKFGFAPYKNETWHWEVRLPVYSWVTGEEFTDNFAVRVTKVGPKVKGFTGSGEFGNTNIAPGAQAGGGSVGSATGAGPCIHVPSNVAGVGEPLQVTNAAPVSGLGDKLVMGTPGSDAVGDDKYLRKLVAFCVHETAGWPTNIRQRKRNQDSYADKGGHPCGVHFWGTSDGGILQTTHPAKRIWHAQGGSMFSTSIETCTMGPTHPRYHGMIKYFANMGFHFVSTTKGKGDILTDEGCTAGNAKTWQVMMLPTPQMQESLYKLIYGLSKNPPSNEGTKWSYGGKSGKTEINIPMAFPAVNANEGKMWWGPWYGKPGSVHWGKADFAANSSEWFKKNQPPGVFCHWNVGHHADGCMGVFYTMARALGMNSSDAFYAMVGAVCTTKYDSTVKNFWTPLPKGADGKELIKKGKAKYPWPLDAKTFVDTPGVTSQPLAIWKNFPHKWKKVKTAWEQLKEEKKVHFGDFDNPT